MTALVDQLNAALPQTQCTRCGYPACLPYAEAIALGDANINQCPPGGQAGVARLADLLNRAETPLDVSFGEEKLVETVALIVEADCIGCTKCIQACPVDAIVGGPNLMHTVITADCTGCELCIPPCPVDCIVMLPAPQLPSAFVRADASRQLFDARNARLARWAVEDEAARITKKAVAADDPVAAALARARAAI